MNVFDHLLLFSILIASAVSYADVLPAPPLEEYSPAEQHDPTALVGANILAISASRLPTEPLSMTGTLTMRRAYGVEIKKFKYAVAIHWGAQKPRAVYEIFDINDTLLETVVAVRTPEGALTLTRFLGAEKTPADPPAINETVRGTDITWLDITLDFVWWRNPVITGEGKVKGRLCDILEVEPAEPLERCKKVRLWIDRDQKLVMQAIQIDENDRDVRRMWIRAIQKINERWVLKDIEVETRGKGHRTRLNVDDVKTLD